MMVSNVLSPPLPHSRFSHQTGHNSGQNRLQLGASVPQGGEGRGAAGEGREAPEEIDKDHRHPSTHCHHHPTRHRTRPV